MIAVVTHHSILGAKCKSGLGFLLRVIGQVFKFYLEMSILCFQQTLLVLIARGPGSEDQLEEIRNK